MTGNITRRGARSGRLKFEDPITGKRKTDMSRSGARRRKEAQHELTRLPTEVENGTAVDPSRITLGEYLWNADNLAYKTRQRYRALVEQQIAHRVLYTALARAT